MVQRICPICDKVMKSAHYCKNCRSWVKHPYVREAAYYLNERHPQDESGCSYHGMDSQTAQGAGTAPGRGSSPYGVWKPVGLPQNTSYPARMPLPQVNTANQARRNEMGGERRPRSGSSAVIGLFLVAAAAGVIALFSGPMLDAARIVLEPPAEYDIDLGDYTGEETQSNVRELDEDDVIAVGERCSARGHFAVQGKLMEQPVLDILDSAGFQVGNHDTYSYNGAYDNGKTWYTTWTSIEVLGDTEDSYQYVELDFDTGTGELHEISLSLEDPELLTAVACEILAELAAQGEIDAGADCFTKMPEELPAALEDGTGYVLLEGAVLIEGLAYEDCYIVYISHNIDSDL